MYYWIINNFEVVQLSLAPSLQMCHTEQVGEIYQLRKGTTKQIAYLFKTFLNHMGFECHLVDGFLREVEVMDFGRSNHTWNLI